MFFRFSRFVYDVDRRVLSCDGQPIHTFPQEREFLQKLLDANGRIIQDADMEQGLQMGSFGSKPVLYVLASRLNIAFKNNGEAGALIRRERNVGYKVDVSPIEKVEGDFAAQIAPIGSADPVDYSKPRITHITGTDDLNELALLRRSFACYRELFPTEERDSEQDIEEWMEDNGRNQNAPWFDIWSVLHTEDAPIGISFLTANRERPYIIGNYFGVLRGWRQNKQAINFLEEVVRVARKEVPKATAILFEVDPVEFKLMRTLGANFNEEIRSNPSIESDTAAFFQWLGKAANEHRRARSPSQNDMLKRLRNLRRLWLYRSYRAKILLNSEGQPVRYWQPKVSAETKEVELHLMIYPFKGTTADEIDLRDMANFIYDEFYAAAYADEDSETFIQGYAGHLVKVKNEFLEQIVDGCKFGRLEKLPELKRFRSAVKLLAPERLAL